MGRILLSYASRSFLRSFIFLLLCLTAGVLALPPATALPGQFRLRRPVEVQTVTAREQSWHHGSAHSPHPVSYEPKGPDCDLCEDNWLFILSPGGRTGSTTALDMLKSIPGVEIGGEHMGLLEQEMATLKLIERNYYQEWDLAAFRHRDTDMHSLKCVLQEKMKRIIFGKDYKELSRDARVLGFKEIRYRELPILRFIAEVFPCARYVFTYRENTDVEITADGFTQTLASQWADSGRLFHEIKREFGSTVEMIPVERMSVAAFNRVLHDLLGVRGCSFDHVVHDNANGGYREDESSERDKLIQGECDLSAVNFRLDSEELGKHVAKWALLGRQLGNSHKG